MTPSLGPDSWVGWSGWTEQGGQTYLAGWAVPVLELGGAGQFVPVAPAGVPWVNLL